MTPYSKLVIVVLASASTLLAGCVTEQMAGKATDLNLAVEQTNNKMLLLNILRASKRRPLYLTSLTAIHGGAGWTPASIGASIPFGPGAVTRGNGTITPSFGYAASTFDMGVLDAQEFMRGFTTPIDMKTFKYLWDQGWPRELLWMLFVQKFDISYGQRDLLDKPAKDLANQERFPLCDGETASDRKISKSQTFQNYPERPSQMKAFKCKSRQLLGDRFGFIPKKNAGPSLIGPKLSEADTSSLKQLVAVQAVDGLSLETVEKNKYFQLQSGKPDFVWDSDAKCEFDATDPSPPGNGAPACQKYFYDHHCKDDKFKNTDPCARQTINVTMRSPEAVIYYLGELVRVQLRAEALSTSPQHEAAYEAADQLKALICSYKSPPEQYKNQESKYGREDWLLDSEVPIFEVKKLSTWKAKLHLGDSDATVVKVTYDDEDYAIVRESQQEYFDQCAEQSSMHVLSLVNQLIGLQKSVKDLPATGVVRVVQ